MHVLARESCCTCHFPHLLCQRWSILIMKNTHCQYRWEPAGQRSGNKVSSHSMGNRNYAVNSFWNFFLGFKCSSKYWSCLSHIGKLKTYRCPRFVDGWNPSTPVIRSAITFCFNLVSDCATTYTSKSNQIPMACKTPIQRGAFSVTRTLAHWEYHC